MTTRMIVGFREQVKTSCSPVICARDSRRFWAQRATHSNTTQRPPPRTLVLLPTSQFPSIIPQTTPVELKRPQPLNRCPLARFARVEGARTRSEQRGPCAGTSSRATYYPEPFKASGAGLSTPPNSGKNYHFPVILADSLHPEELLARDASAQALRRRLVCRLFACASCLEGAASQSSPPLRPSVDTRSRLLPRFGGGVLLLRLAVGGQAEGKK